VLKERDIDTRHLVIYEILQYSYVFVTTVDARSDITSSPSEKVGKPMGREDA
jgi:hypothetical protein